MLGLGESDEELKEAMADLRAIDVDILTLGQYLQVMLSCLWHLISRINYKTKQVVCLWQLCITVTCIFDYFRCENFFS